ncbi:MAG TPA: hypothetical protein VJU53_03655 [Burkholderiaceae bacterium]|nr:hypothetical protein [Burkholderiaceae bacterium]
MNQTSGRAIFEGFGAMPTRFSHDALDERAVDRASGIALSDRDAKANVSGTTCLTPG